MGFWDKFKKTEDVELKMIETRKKLMELEAKLKVIIRKERNVAANAGTRSAKAAAEERLRNAYVSLRMVHIAQERLYDVNSTYELTGAMKDLNKSLAVLNRLDKKGNRISPTLFLNFRSKAILARKGQAEEGGMKQYYDESIEKVLVGEDTMHKLIATGMPIDRILDEDQETLENVDDFMGYATSANNGFDDIDVSGNFDEWDDLVNKLG